MEEDDNSVTSTESSKVQFRMAVDGSMLANEIADEMDSDVE